MFALVWELLLPAFVVVVGSAGFLVVDTVGGFVVDAAVGVLVVDDVAAVGVVVVDGVAAAVGVVVAAAAAVGATSVGLAEIVVRLDEANLSGMDDRSRLFPTSVCRRRLLESAMANFAFQIVR